MTAVCRLPRPMQELNVSNALIGDRLALDAAWERDGYWFFRNVLDLGSVGRLADVYREFLAEHGLIEAGDLLCRYTGASLENFPLRMDPFSERKVWREFVREPAIVRFFTELLQDE